MDLTSEFILMASTLIEIKSKMLLPNFKEKEEEDPRENLVNRLLEYKLFKEVSEDFKDKEREELKFIPKPKEEIEYDEKLNEQVLFEEINVYDLMNSINSLLKRRKLEINREVPSFKFREDHYSVNKCIKIVKNILKEKNKVNLIDVFKIDFNKGFIIAIFLSILELSREKNVKILQDNLFGEIYLMSV
jgi:segregation and condensation protein A